MNARGTRRPHARRPRKQPRSGSSSSASGQAPGCAVIAFLVGFGLLTGSATAVGLLGAYISSRT